MVVDVGALLRRLVVASAPVLTGAGCLCPAPPAPDQPFDWQVMVFEDDSFRLGRAGDPPPLPLDAGADGGLLGKFMPLDMRDAYDRCAHDHAACAGFCRFIAALDFDRVEVHSCQAIGGTEDRPRVQVTGLGSSAVCGRRPPGLARATGRGGSATGRVLGACAALEAASISAFRRLARELTAAGAPAPLATAAQAAAADELRHARAVRALAARHGGGRPVLRTRPTPPRALAALARDNAAEGCVRETFGALVAHLQARTAADPAVRAVMTAIAEDETRHAQLGWDLEDWAATRLSAAERRTVRGSREGAVAELRAASPEPPAVARALGLPPPALGAALIDELAASLWAQS
jgi:hypothetical protein